MSAIDDKYAALGGSSGFLGTPTGPESVAPDGTGHFRHYQNGSIYWHPSTGAHEVHGAIRQKWSGLGWERSFLGYPSTDETATPDGQGRFNHFQGGSVYWHPATGAHEVHGAIRQKWAALGWERSFLGYPITDETPTPAPNPQGRFNHFQGGSVYWSPSTGAFEVHGAIRQKWASLGWERSFLGFPTTDELTTPDGHGRFNHFSGGSVYWSPTTGAFEVHGAIRALWAANGWEAGRYGYPLSDETPMNPQDSGRFNRFQHGTIGWTPGMAAWADFAGVDPQGRFEGNIQVFQDNNFSGSNRTYPLTTERPIAFYQTINADGLNDRISSVAVTLPTQCSVYLFEHSDFKGRWVRINGSTTQVRVASLPSENDAISSIVTVNHGLSSVIVTPATLQSTAMGALASFSIGGVAWNAGSPTVFVQPDRRLRARMQGTIAETWPDSWLDLSVYFRLYVTGPTTVTAAYDGWHADFGGSFFGYANDTISQRLHSFLDSAATQRTLEGALNNAFATQLSALGSVPESLRPIINVRRLNFLPEGLEVVLSDDEEDALLRLGGVQGIAPNPTPGQVTTGTV